MFGDKTCSTRFLTVHIEGPYEIGAASATVAGANEARFAFTKKTVTPHSAAAAAFLSSENGCKLPGFAEGVALDVGASGCAALVLVTSQQKGLDNVEVLDVDAPVPGPGEARVAMAFAPINPADLLLASDSPPTRGRAGARGDRRLGSATCPRGGDLAGAPSCYHRRFHTAVNAPRRMRGMLRRLVYASDAREGLTEADLEALLAVARRNNEAAGVTGMLVYADGDFLQVLEGEADAIAALYAKIELDPRHHGSRVILDSLVEKRAFEGWSMGFRAMSKAALLEVPGFVDLFDGELVPRALEWPRTAAHQLLLGFRSLHAGASEG